MKNIEIRTFTSRGFEQNGYLVWRNGGERAVAIDPGADASAMSAVLAAENLEMEAVLLTHAHIDHVQGVPALVRQTGAPVYMHRSDAPLYDRAADQAAMFGMPMEVLPAIAGWFEAGTDLELAGLRFEVRHVPGHSPGHVILYVADAGVAFVGDVIFMNSIGRTDLPGGDFGQLIAGIRAHVFTLPAETVLYPGHGPATTVDHEKLTNPFLVPSYGGGLA